MRFDVDGETGVPVAGAGAVQVGYGGEACPALGVLACVLSEHFSTFVAGLPLNWMMEASGCPCGTEKCPHETGSHFTS